GARISEVPITLYKDGRTVHRPHLRTFRDGWRTLRFYLLQSPRWTFLVPGAALGVCGVLGAMLALWNVNLAGVIFDAHTLLVATLALLVSAQLLSCAVLAKTFAAGEGLLPRDNRLEKLSHVFTLERCLSASALLIVGGTATVLWKAFDWASSGFGPLNYSATMKCLIPAIGAIALGVQLAASSFLLSVLRMARR
ncbi:MAG: glycosyltransferase family 2 protein, partial [Pirellulaceae bacterium]|nr:glycosyltransferase family 2 protein [Pirellulaceae bacterium]